MNMAIDILLGMQRGDTVATFFPDNGTQYHVTELGVEGFNESFDMLVHDQLPDSFYRRIMVRGIRYALLYHLLLKKIL